MSKRRALTELNHDNYEDALNADGDGARDAPTLPRASDEELAGRKILKLRRTLPPQVSPPSNPIKASPQSGDINDAAQQTEGAAPPSESGDAASDVKAAEIDGKVEGGEAVSKSPAAESSNSVPAAEESSDAAGKVSNEGESGNKEEPPATAAPPVSHTGIFGDLFSKPFTNPLAQVREGLADGPKSSLFGGSNIAGPSESAAVGGGLFASHTAVNHDQPKPTDSDSTAAAPCGQNDGDAPSDEVPLSLAATPMTAAPASFPGEEDEEVVYSDGTTVLLKCVNTGTTESPVWKFKRQGEGLLSLLKQKEGEKKRLVVRQKGTWALLMNSPLEVSKKFDNTSTAAVKFVALDNTTTTHEGKLALAAYCVKFVTPAKRADFLAAVGAE